MPFNEWYTSLISQQAVGSSVAGTSQASVLNGQAKFTLPAQFLKYIGQKLKIRAAGIMTTPASSPGTLTWTVMFGSIAVYAGGASGTLATSQSNVPWSLEIDLTVRAVGSSTSAIVAGSGKFFSAALGSPAIQVLASPGGLTGFDTTVATIVDLQATLSSASANVTVEDFELEG